MIKCKGKCDFFKVRRYMWCAQDIIQCRSLFTHTPDLRQPNRNRLRTGSSWENVCGTFFERLPLRTLWEIISGLSGKFQQGGEGFNCRCIRPEPLGTGHSVDMLLPQFSTHCDPNIYCLFINVTTPRYGREICMRVCVLDFGSVPVVIYQLFNWCRINLKHFMYHHHLNVLISRTRQKQNGRQVLLPKAF